MKLPRDISGEDFARALSKLGYEITRRSGSHIRLTTERNGIHHVTIPSHSSLKIGTLSAVIRDIAGHHEMKKDDLMNELFK